MASSAVRNSIGKFYWQLNVMQAALTETTTGIYCGWASVSTLPGVYKMCMSVGWNPFYKNEKKTAEPWLLHKFDADFYGITLLISYVRLTISVVCWCISFWSSNACRVSSFCHRDCCGTPAMDWISACMIWNSLNVGFAVCAAMPCRCERNCTVFSMTYINCTVVIAGKELRLLVCGFIRPEADFTSLDALIARIHEDANVSRAALDQSSFARLAHDSFLHSQTQPT